MWQKWTLHAIAYNIGAKFEVPASVTGKQKTCRLAICDVRLRSSVDRLPSCHCGGTTTVSINRCLYVPAKAVQSRDRSNI